MNLIELPSQDIPQFTCHKEVRAIKIEGVGARRIDGATLILNGIDEPLHLTPAELDRLRPQESGYLVIYNDGYISWSPADAFEAGYTPKDGDTEPGLIDEYGEVTPGFRIVEVSSDYQDEDIEVLLALYDDPERGEEMLVSETEANLLTHALSDRAQAATELDDEVADGGEG